jgi:hypothetical protein
MNAHYGETPQLPSPVLSISIFDQVISDKDLVSEGAKIQVVVRDPQTNETHPNVISIPTHRVPDVLFRAILESAEWEEEFGSTTFYKAGDVDNISESAHHPVVYAVETILSRKLGVANELELGTLRFRAALRAVTKGKSVYPDSESLERTEHIAMANIRVIITHGAQLFPLNSPSYSSIFWVSLNRFLETVRQKDPLVLNLDPIEYCIHGLCISTAYDMLAHQFGFERYSELLEF